jgi:hypothetical protein
MLGFEFVFEPPTGLDSVFESPYTPSPDAFCPPTPVALSSQSVGGRVFEPPENTLYTLAVI